MNLFVLRHASAGQRLANPELDRKRPLDKEGKNQCLLMGGALNALNIQFDCVVSSPLKRALQTASLVGTETGYDQKVIVSAALAPEGTWRDFQTLLTDISGFEDVLVVGHNPNLSHFLNALLGASAHQDPIRMRKGAGAKLNLDRQLGRFQWLVDPKITRAIQPSSVKSSRPKTSRK